MLVAIAFGTHTEKRKTLFTYKTKEMAEIKNLVGDGVSDDSMNCKQTINIITSIKYNPETKEVFDELDNFLGYGTYNKESNIISIEQTNKQ